MRTINRKNATMFCISIACRILFAVIGTAFMNTFLQAQTPNPALIGYWHNWNDNNAPYIHLDSVDAYYNIIAVSFAVPTSNADMTMQFVPDRGSVAEFVQRIQRVQNQGKKVLLSIGGATSSIDLSTTANKNAFINSMTALLDNYGFDGIDVDIEHGASILIAGGTIASPQNTAQLNLIDAIRQIMANYRSTFSRKMFLTMAPETAYIQGGMSGFGSIWGGYLPIVHALRDSLDILHVQLYNSGTMYGIDGNIYTQGTADFIVAMTEAVIQGFTTGGGVFVGLPASKVAVGLPASTSAAGGGFVDSLTVSNAVQYLLGKGNRPGQYVLRQQGGYSALRGLMTWSINWDALGGNRTTYSFAKGYYGLFGPPPLPYPDRVVLASPETDRKLATNNIQLQWKESHPAVALYHLEISTGNSNVLSDSTLAALSFSFDNLLPATAYSWRVRAKNAKGWSDWSQNWTFHSVPFPLPVQQLSPDSSAQLRSNTVEFVWNTSTPYVSEYRLVLNDAAGAVVADTILSDTSYRRQVAPARSYSWKLQAKNTSGWSDWSQNWTFHSVPFPLPVQQLSPDSSAQLRSNTVEFVWNTSTPHVSEYRLVLSDAAGAVVADTTLSDTSYRRQVAPARSYSWKLQAKNISGWGDWSQNWTFHSVPFPMTVELLAPDDGAEFISDSIQFAWTHSKPDVSHYRLELYAANALIYSDSTIADSSLILRGLQREQNYQWRVQGRNESGWGEWSDMRKAVLKKDTITTQAPETQLFKSSVFPNPANDVISIRLPQGANDPIVVYDIRGTIVLQADRTADSVQIIDISRLAAGMYSIRIANDMHCFIKHENNIW